MAHKQLEVINIIHLRKCKALLVYNNISDCFHTRICGMG